MDYSNINNDFQHLCVYYCFLLSVFFIFITQPFVVRVRNCIVMMDVITSYRCVSG